jgi:hypothetical protein
MNYPLGYASEREYEEDCALEARSARLAAIACNDIFTLTQAKALQLACDALPLASVFMIESAFEEYGWPHDYVDTAWLNEAGRATWEIFTAWRAS